MTETAVLPREECSEIAVILVKPSNYGPDGYVRRYRKAIIPSNTIAVMNSLTEQALKRPKLRRLHSRVRCFDEICQRVDPEAIMHEYGQPGVKIVVGFVGVQTNQFPRTLDLAEEFLSYGATVAIGGFHVSGSITMLVDGKDGLTYKKEMPPELQSCIDRGIILFHGEAENEEIGWAKVLEDIVSGTPQPLYRGGRPDISHAPFPEYPDGYFDHFLLSDSFDAGRGCPFDCSFCTIINVQGRTPRYRGVLEIITHVRRMTAAHPGIFFFITDDNFARNPHWKEILSELITLRKEGYQFTFMAEADLAAWKLPGFIELMAEAGCTELFMGVESMNQQTLFEAHKRQNQVQNYREMCDHYHKAGIFLHAGYIIGFPNDTPESITEDIRALKQSGFDHASFFNLTPMPGSLDHLKARIDGVPMDADLNRYDSFQPVVDHPKMTREEWMESYQNAWLEFYSPEHMIEVLKRTRPELYFNVMRKFFWYRWSALAEKTHPMISGLYRIRRFDERRPEMPISFFRHFGSEIARHLGYPFYLARELGVFQRVYFQTRWLPTLCEKAASFGDAKAFLAKRFELVQAQEQEWRRRFAKSHWFGRTFGRAAHREWLNDFWRRYGRERWNLLVNPSKWTWHIRTLPHAITEVVYFIRFSWAVTRAIIQKI